MTTKCPKNRVNRPVKSKMKGTAARNASRADGLVVVVTPGANS